MGFLMLVALSVPVGLGVLFYFLPELGFGAMNCGIRLWGGLKRSTVEVEGLKWAYLDSSGDETILFVHGFGAGKDRWGTFLPAFSRRFRVVAPDLPGFGESSRPMEADYDVLSQVERLHRFVTRMGLDAFHLVGSSMGGYIGGVYAATYPEKVESLALIDPAGVRSPEPGYVFRHFEETGENLLLYRTPHEFEKTLAVVYHRPPWVPKPYKSYLAREGDRNYRLNEKVLDDIAKAGAYLLEPRLVDIEAETLVLWGAEDRVLHVSGTKTLEGGLPRCRTRIIEGCGHVPYVEKARETRRICRDFLADLRGSGMDQV